MLLKKLLGEVPMTYSKKGGAPAQQPMVAPSAPVEEASVEIDDENAKNKLKTSKQSLKIPLAKMISTGLKV